MGITETQPKGWKETTLGEVAEIIDGDRGVNYPKTDEFSRGGYCLFLNTKNVPDTEFSFSGMAFISREKDENMGKGRMRRGDFVLTTRGTVGNFAFYSDKISFENIRINSGMVILRINEDILEKQYFKFYLRSPLFRGQIIQFSSGSAQPQLPIRDLKSFVVRFPEDIDEQIEIARVLSSLDDKIELLRRQNETLEAMARAIFHEWFVAFNFPNEQGKPYKTAGGKMVESELGEIPEGWKVGKLGKEIETILGGTPNTERREYWQNGTIPWINSGAVNSFRIYEPTIHITEKALEESAAKLMPRGTVVIAITGATLGQVSRLEINSAGNQSVIGILPNEKFSSAYLYYWTLENISKIINTATGGAQQHINKNDVNSFDFIIPAQMALGQYSEIANPIMERISGNCFQIKTLSQNRDILLPKLMSGEVRVKI